MSVNTEPIDNESPTSTDHVHEITHIVHATETKDNKKTIAKRRWALLAKALQSPKQFNNHLDKISLRRFTSYTLIKSNPRQDLCNNDIKGWYEYTAHVHGTHYRVLISHPQQCFTPAELSGFNNTGNICVWPSEETLAYYSLANRDLFENRTVLELGGGMSCLAGLMIACHLNAAWVHLSDGNSTAVENIRRSIDNNVHGTPLTCSVLKWDRNDNIYDVSTYDVIICADCLFFDDSRTDLIETIWNHLADKGLALVMAPRRGNTFDEFTAQAKKRGFACQKMICYNERVWERHVAFINNPEYDENVHYPLLLRLTKPDFTK